MSRIKGKDTRPEKILRSQLYKYGFRFRVNYKELPGKPDIVLPKYRTIIFVHGCFWHYHKDCREGRIPSTNSNFWKEKLERTIARDKLNIIKLEEENWNVIIVWECEIEKKIDEVFTNILYRIKA